MALSPTSKIENNDSEVFSYEKKVNAGSNVSYPNSDIVSHEHGRIRYYSYSIQLLNNFRYLPIRCHKHSLSKNKCNSLCQVAKIT